MKSPNLCAIGEDNQSLILNYLPVSHDLDPYQRIIQEAATSFLAEFLQGSMETLTPGDPGKELNLKQLVPGMVYASALQKTTLETTLLIKPIEDGSPD